MTGNLKTAEKIARALGAHRVMPLGKVEHTPFGMLALTDRVRKLRSIGPAGSGRPSDPSWTLMRIIRFKPSTWRQLARIAAQEHKRTGRRVSPAQVAAILLEELIAPGPRRRRAQ